MRSRVLPSLPTTCPTRFSSCAICWLAATISLNVSAIFPASPVQIPAGARRKSPSRMVCRLASKTLSSPEPISERTPRPLLLGSALTVSAAASAAAPSVLFIIFSRQNDRILCFTILSKKFQAKENVPSGAGDSIGRFDQFRTSRD